MPPNAAAEIQAVLKGAPAPVAEDEAEEATVDPLAGIEERARERIKDLIINLGWKDMQELVAGILRAMGYKTQVSPDGADRGKDIVASPDGFGFEHPRIVVEVKHRKGQMDSQEIRSFSAVATRMIVGCTLAPVVLQGRPVRSRPRFHPGGNVDVGPCGPCSDRALRCHRRRNQAHRAAEATVLACLSQGNHK